MNGINKQKFYRQFSGRFIAFLLSLAVFSVLTNHAQNLSQQEKIRQIIARAGSPSSLSMSDYYFKMNYTARSVDKKKREKILSRRYEVFIPSKQPPKRISFPLVTLEKDGKPLSDAEIQKERERAGKRLEEIEKNAMSGSSPSQEKPDANAGYFELTTQTNGLLSSEKTVVNILSFLESCKFSDLREETYNDRKTYILRFRPKSPLKLKTEEIFLDKVEGQIWIDAADGRVVRLEAFPINALPENEDSATRQLKAAIFYQQIRLPDGVWLVERARLNGLDFPNLFNKLQQTIEVKFSEYRRFTTEVKEVTTEVDGANRQ